MTAPRGKDHARSDLRSDMDTQRLTVSESRVTLDKAGTKIIGAARLAQRHNAASVLYERGEDVAVLISLADYAQYKRLLVSHLRSIAATSEWHSTEEVIAIAKAKVAAEHAEPHREDDE
jgi:hypothetical protein